MVDLGVVGVLQGRVGLLAHRADGRAQHVLLLRQPLDGAALVADQPLQPAQLLVLGLELRDLRLLPAEQRRTRPRRRRRHLRRRRPPLVHVAVHRRITVGRAVLLLLLLDLVELLELLLLLLLLLLRFGVLAQFLLQRVERTEFHHVVHQVDERLHFLQLVTQRDGRKETRRVTFSHFLSVFGAFGARTNRAKPGKTQ